MQRLSVPHLQTLTLSALSGYFLNRSQKSAEVIDLFTEMPNLVLLKPKILVLDIKMSTVAAILVLQMWSQLQHITLKFDDFDAHGLFARTLTNNVDPLSPNLISCAWTQFHRNSTPVSISGKK
jgi:hypothetical protein